MSSIRYPVTDVMGCQAAELPDGILDKSREVSWVGGVKRTCVNLIYDNIQDLVGILNEPREVPWIGGVKGPGINITDDDIQDLVT